MDEYININKIAELKGLTSNRALRLAIQKGKYVARVVKVFGGKPYEILCSSLEPEIQRILRGVAECVSQSEQMANDEFGICATVNGRRRISSTLVRDTHRSKRTPIASKPVEGCEAVIIQDEKLQDELIKETTQSNCTALVSLNSTTKYPTFISERAKLTAQVGLKIIMSENTQCIASALRNVIINLGMIPKVVYQDNGRAFKAKYFHDKQGEKNLSRSLTSARCDFLAQALKNQHTCQYVDFDKEGFNGIYANLGIKSVFAKPYNARAKVIERFFLEFQEEFGKKLDYLILQAK